MAIVGAVGCAVTASAKSPGTAIAGCTLGGVGYLGTMLSYSIPSEITPRKYRSLVQAYMSVIAVAGAALGLIGGGAFTHNSTTTTNSHSGSWRNFYWFECGGYLLIAILFAALYNPPARVVIASKTATFDVVGNILLASGLTLFLVGITSGGGAYPWKSAHVIAPICIGAVLLFAFIVYGIFGRKDGILHHELFTKRNFVICLIAVMIEGWIFTANLGWLAQEIGVLYESNVLLGNARFWVYQAVSLPTSVLVGWISYKTKRVRELLVVGYIIFLGGVIGFSEATPKDSAASIGWTALFGVGFCIPLLLLLVAMQLAVPPELIATATALFFTARSFAGSIGNAIFSAIFTAKYTARLGPAVAEAVLPLGLSTANLPAFIGDLATGDIAAIMQIPGVTTEMLEVGGAALQNAWAQSVKYGWYSLIPPAAIGIISCACLQPVSADMNDQVDAPVDGPVKTEAEIVEKGVEVVV